MFHHGSQATKHAELQRLQKRLGSLFQQLETCGVFIRENHTWLLLFLKNTTSKWDILVQKA